MLTQDRLRLLLDLYNRRLADVAAAAGMPKSTASELINCRRPASQEQITRLEAAIIGHAPRREGDAAAAPREGEP